MVRALVGPVGGLTPAQRTRYSRQILLEGFGEEGQRRLLGARMLVVGAGGLGSSALLYLAAAGVGTIGIVDDDAVDLSNLHRQVIHDSTGVGSPKTSSAAARLRALNPDVTVLEHRERLTDTTARQIVAGYDIVLDGSDNFPTRYLVDAVCSELSIPEVWGSILRCTAQISVFWTGPRARAAGVPEPVCLRDLFPGPPPPGSTPGCGEAGVFGPLCGQVGSIMAGEAIKLATGMGDPLIGRVLVVDMLSVRSQTVPLSANPNRPPAGQKAPDGACATRSEVPQIDVRELAGIVGQIRDRTRGAGREPAETESAETVPIGEVPGCAETVGDAAAAGGSGGGDPLAAQAILDVREPREREICAIPGSVHIPLAEVLADPAGIADRLSLNGGTVYVYCLGGSRSLKAAQALVASGVHAVNVAGGIRAWWTQIDPFMPRY